MTAGVKLPSRALETLQGNGLLPAKKWTSVSAFCARTEILGLYEDNGRFTRPQESGCSQES